MNILKNDEVPRLPVDTVTLVRQWVKNVHLRCSIPSAYPRCHENELPHCLLHCILVIAQSMWAANVRVHFEAINVKLFLFRSCLCLELSFGTTTDHSIHTQHYQADPRINLLDDLIVMLEGLRIVFSFNHLIKLSTDSSIHDAILYTPTT